MLFPFLWCRRWDSAFGGAPRQTIINCLVGVVAVSFLHRFSPTIRSREFLHPQVPPDKKKPGTAFAVPVFMVPKVGLEPTRYHYQRILSPSRLPFHHFGFRKLYYYTAFKIKLQAFEWAFSQFFKSFLYSLAIFFISW